MSSSPSTFVIAGANLAGGTAAATLRDEGFDGRLVLVGEEPVAPYERPPLSKGFLRGETPFEQALLRPPGFWQEQDIECQWGLRVARIDPGTREVTLSDGDSLRYDKVLVTTGLRNRTLHVPGAGLEGVHTLRTVADAEALKAEIVAGRTAVVVGMGFIGAEVAASLRLSGLEVEVVEPLAAPVVRAVGPLVAGVIAAIHRDHGIAMHFGESAAAFEGTSRVEAVVTSSGRRIGCDFVVVGVGTVPVTDLLEGTGVVIDNGVVVDEHCRSSVDGVYAAGDVANHFHPTHGRHIRVEHWQNALKQGAAAAKSMLGSHDPYDDVHWFWSDQYDTNIQSAGLPSNWNDLVVRGDVEGRSFVAFYLRDRRIEGAVAVNRGKDLRRAIALIHSGAVVDPGLLADPGTDVRAAAR